MPNPKPFDGYVEQTLRVSSTSLIHFQRNRYSVPSSLTNHVVSVHSYPTYLSIVHEGQEVARHERSFERYLTFYDWRRYIDLVSCGTGHCVAAAARVCGTSQKTSRWAQRQIPLVADVDAVGHRWTSPRFAITDIH